MTSLSPSQRRIFVETGIWLSIVVGLWAYSFQFDRPIEAERFSVVAWPRAILILLTVFAILSFVTQMRSSRIAAGKDEEASEEERTASHYLAVAGTLLLPLIYAFFIPRLGFLLLTPFFVAGYMYLFRQRSLIHLIGTNLLFVSLLAVLFTRFLYLPLPTGYWPGFYELGTAIVQTINAF